LPTTFVTPMVISSGDEEVVEINWRCSPLVIDG